MSQGKRERHPFQLPLNSFTTLTLFIRSVVLPGLEKEEALIFLLLLNRQSPGNEQKKESSKRSGIAKRESGCFADDKSRAPDIPIPKALVSYLGRLHQNIPSTSYLTNNRGLSVTRPNALYLIYGHGCLHFSLPVNSPGSLTGHHACRHSTLCDFRTRSSPDPLPFERLGLLRSYPQAQIPPGIWTTARFGISCPVSNTHSRIFPKRDWRVCRKSILHYEILGPIDRCPVV